MTLEQAEAKAKETFITIIEFWGGEPVDDPEPHWKQWASTPSGQQLIQSLVSEGAADKWGYMVNWNQLSIDDLNVIGRKGWEMCGFYNSNQGLNCFYFKRKLAQ